MQSAIDGVMNGDEYFDLVNKLKLNIANFSAHKALTVTKLINRQRADENGVVRAEKEYQQAAKKVLNLYQTRQITEHNTAVRRARTARQFSQFSQNEVRNKLYPNLKWIPSRSATPRELHRHFWNKVWSKNDSFWNQNQPGNLWNCKCDIVETDEPATDNPSFGSSAMVGLEGNPAITGEIFTQKASYFNAPESTAAKAIYKKFEQNNAEYLFLLKNKDYKNINFNWKNAGLMATHKNHNIDKLTGKSEIEVQKIGFSNGNKVILGEEFHNVDNLRNIDGTWNGLNMEISNCKSATKNNIRNSLKHCASKRLTEVAVLYFDEKFNLDEFLRGLKMYDGLKSTSQYIQFKKIICIHRGSIIYEKSHQ